MSEAKIDDSPKSITRSSMAFLSGTFLSRVTGLGRDMVMAFCFGSNAAVAAFMMAFRFSNLIRRLFGEGPLPAGFIPHFEELRGQSPDKGAQFFRDLLFSLALFLILLIGVSEIVLVSIWQWGNLSPGAAQVLYLTILMLPGVLFICLFGLSSGLLQCERKFFLTGFAPAAFNVVWMVAAWWLKGKEPSSAMVFLSVAIVMAFAMQWMMIAPHMTVYLRKFLSLKECLKPHLFSAEMRRIIKPFLLGAIGIGAMQINSALDAVFARFASLEGPAYLWYAIRLEQLPLALFGIALSAAILPPLARAVKEDAVDQYQRLLRFAFRRGFSLIFPCTMGIFVLGASAVNLIYGRGDFTNEATYQTVICLWGYGIGLVPAVLVLLLAPAFYAKKDFRTPAFGSLYSVILNIALSAFMVFVLKWGAFSIAVATSICAWANYFYLSHHLSRKMGGFFDRQVLSSFSKTGICTLIAAGATLLVGLFLSGDATISICFNRSAIFSRSFSLQALQFIALAGTFGLMLVSYAWMFNAQDLLNLLGVKKQNTLPTEE